MRRFAWPLLALLLLRSAPVRAQNIEAPQAAEALFKQGREAYKRKDYPAALQLFRKSQGIYPSPGTLFNLAVCEEELGMTASAHEHYRDLLSRLPAKDKRIEVVQASLAGLEVRVPRVRISLAQGAPPGASVTLDEVPLAAESLGKEVPVDPGKHTVAVKAPGVGEQRYVVSAEEGKRVELVIDPSRAAPPAAPPTDGPSRRTPGFVVGSIGLAGLAGGAVTGAMALQKHGELRNPAGACSASRTCASVAGAGKALSWASTAAFAVGLAGVGAGIYLVVSGPRSATPVKISWTVGIAPGPDGGTATLTASF